MAILASVDYGDTICEAEVRKNLVLADTGQPLTLPLATLQRNCFFKKEWNKMQKKWHGNFIFDFEKEKQKTTMREYYKKNKSKLNANQREYMKDPEIREKNRVRSRKYYWENREEILKKLRDKTALTSEENKNEE